MVTRMQYLKEDAATEVPVKLSYTLASGSPSRKGLSVRSRGGFKEMGLLWESRWRSGLDRSLGSSGSLKKVASKHWKRNRRKGASLY